jgi:hypothetical protein
MRNFARCAGLAAGLWLASIAAPMAATAGDAPVYIAVDIIVQGASGASTVHLVGRSGEEATNATPSITRTALSSQDDISIAVRPELQPNGRIRLHYEVKTVDVARHRAAGSANAPAEYPRIRDVMVIDDVVLEDGVAVTKPLGGGTELSLRARRLAQPPADPHPAEARLGGTK